MPITSGECGTTEGVSIPFTAKDKDIIEVQLSIEGTDTDFLIQCGGVRNGWHTLSSDCLR